MSALSHKIDFAIIFSVKNANPNGDPLNGNRPRTDYDGIGEVTDVCLKRKIRDRLQSDNYAIFVQSDEKKTDGMPSLKERAIAESPIGLGEGAFKKSRDETAKLACENGLMCVRLVRFLLLKKGKKKMPKVYQLLFEVQ